MGKSEGKDDADRNTDTFITPPPPPPVVEGMKETAKV